MKTYRSKFGWVVFGILVVVFAIITITQEYQGMEDILIRGVVFTPFLLFFVFISIQTKYIITDKEVVIKCPPFYNKKIPIYRITKVEKTWNPISSPAPSLDRIEIYYGKYDSIIISPKNKTEFMEYLQSINNLLGCNLVFSSFLDA